MNEIYNADMYELFVHQKYFGILKKTLYNLPKVTRLNVLKWFKYDFVNQFLGQY